MQHVVVDMSRLQSDRSLSSESRLKRRLDRELKDAIDKLFAQRSVSDLTDPGAVTIKIKLDEPEFRFNRNSGDPTFVIPGNPQFNVGDHILRPQGQGCGCGGGASAGLGINSEDEFVFEAPTDELDRRVMEDLKLPNMENKRIVRVSQETFERAGFRPDGAPAQLDMVRSARKAVGRRKALGRPSRKEILEVEAELQELRERDQTDEATLAAIATLEQSLAHMRSRRRTTPYIEKSDLRYRNTRKVEIPISQAVIFMMMDVSGSMGEHHKNLAKRFFWLLRRLIQLEYREVDIVCIKHTDVAQEVSEKDFFFSRDSGGTVVSSALEKMLEIVRERYPLDLWNLYCCQATDGDTWTNYKGEDDALTSASILQEQILPIVQYYAYIECWDHEPGSRKGGSSSPLWIAYEAITRSRKFQMQKVHRADQIFHVFKNLFRDPDARKQQRRAA